MKIHAKHRKKCATFYVTHFSKKGETNSGSEVISAWQNGLDLNQRNTGVKVLCLTTWLPFYIQGYEIVTP